MTTNKILRIVETWGNIFTAMTKPQIAYLSEAVSAVILKLSKGAMVWRDGEATNSKFHAAAEQFTVDADTGDVTPASNIMGDLTLIDFESAGEKQAAFDANGKLIESTEILDTDDINVLSPSTESVGGVATELNEALESNVGAIEANTESILNLTGASMKIAQLGGTFAITETMFDFDTITPSDNTDLIDANDTTNIVTLGKALRYQFQTFISITSSGAQPKTLTIRVRNNADDTLLNERDIEILGGNGNAQVFALDPALLDNPLAGLEIYFTAQCTDTNVNLVELNTTISTGGGGGGGIWDVQDGEVVNIGNRPVTISVATAGIGNLTVTGTGTAYDSTYIDNASVDSFGNPILDDGVNTVIKDSTNAYWCIATGLITVNPVFTATQYVNFTGSIEGVYTAELGVGTDGTATIAGGGSGSHAIDANAEIVAPVLEIAGKASRRYDHTGGYIVDTIIEPETGAAYVTFANGVPREATPVGGVGKAKNVFRSLFVGGNTSDDPNEATDIANTGFDPAKIPCNTDTTGADLGVGGSVQVLGMTHADGGVTVDDGVSGEAVDIDKIGAVVARNTAYSNYTLLDRTGLTATGGDLDLRALGAGDLLLQAGGDVIATAGAKTGETGAENAAAGAADGGTLMSKDGIREYSTSNPSSLVFESTDANVTVTSFGITEGIGSFTWVVAFNTTASISANGNLFACKDGVGGTVVSDLSPAFEIRPIVYTQSGSSPIFARVLSSGYILAGRTIAIGTDNQLHVTITY